MGDIARMMYIYWRKGRKTNHIVWSGDQEKTLCSLKIIDSKKVSCSLNHPNICKKCDKIHKDGVYRYSNP